MNNGQGEKLNSTTSVIPPEQPDYHGGPLRDFAVGDINSDEKGSGARANAGKPNYSLLPLKTLEPVVRVWENGEQKYSAWNWSKGMAWSVPLACMIRHISAYQAGQTYDPETNQSHMAHVICNAMMLLHYEKHYSDGDDRPDCF